MSVFATYSNAEEEAPSKTGIEENLIVHLMNFMIFFLVAYKHFFFPSSTNAGTGSHGYVDTEVMLTLLSFRRSSWLQ